MQSSKSTKVETCSEFENIQVYHLRKMESMTTFKKPLIVSDNNAYFIIQHSGSKVHYFS